MGKRFAAFLLPVALLAGGFLYADTQNAIRHQNGRYLREMQTGSYSRQEQTYTEAFSLLPGNRYRQHLWLGEGKSLDNFGAWSVRPDAPERLSDDQIVLHGVVTPDGRGQWDVEVPAQAFHDAQAEASRFHHQQFRARF